MQTIRDLSIEAYDYPLPENRIAKYPLAERDASKLLVLKGNHIEETQFRHIGDYLPEKALLVFNETKVLSPMMTIRLHSVPLLRFDGSVWWGTPSVGVKGPCTKPCQLKAKTLS